MTTGFGPFVFARFEPVALQDVLTRLNATEGNGNRAELESVIEGAAKAYEAMYRVGDAFLKAYRDDALQEAVGRCLTPLQHEWLSKVHKCEVEFRYAADHLLAFARLPEKKEISELIIRRFVLCAEKATLACFKEGNPVKTGVDTGFGMKGNEYLFLSFEKLQIKKTGKDTRCFTFPSYHTDC